MDLSIIYMDVNISTKHVNRDVIHQSQTRPLHLYGVLLGVPLCPVASHLQLLGGWRCQDTRSRQREDEDQDQDEGGDDGKHD